MTPSNSAFKPKEQWRSSALLLLTSSLLAVVLAACQTTPKPTGDVQFFSGKAQVFDKKKNKEEWIGFSSAVHYPSHLRMDVYYTMLNIPVGTLVLNGNKATLLSFVEKKAYITSKGDQVLERLMKTPMSPADITAIFSEKFPLKGAWSCGGAPDKQRCIQNEIQIDWQAKADKEREMKVESPKSKVTFHYEPEASGKAEFELTIPKGYEVIEL